MSKWWQWPEELKEEESHNKLAKATEEYEKQLSILEKFEKTDKWSGLGESMDVPLEKLRDEFKAELKDGIELNSGKYGVVWKTSFRGVTLARKTVKLEGFTKDQVKLALNEGRIARGLDRHRHIVKIVGTCLQDFNTAKWDNSELHILMFPVAHCDLANFLDDCEEISAPFRSSFVDMPGRLHRLVALGFQATKSAEELRQEIQCRLKEIIGCLADAVAWMHMESIEHRDLKPANILVRPGQILITDFGISRIQDGTARNTTDYHVGYTLGYAAPEVLQGDYYNPKEGDIYSLGCVFLHILTVIYGPNVKMANTRGITNMPRDVARERNFRAYIRGAKPDPQSNIVQSHQFFPLELTTLLSSMLDENRKQRPSINIVNLMLRACDASGQQEYFGACCRSNEAPLSNPQNSAMPEIVQPLPQFEINSPVNERSSTGEQSQGLTVDSDSQTQRSHGSSVFTTNATEVSHATSSMRTTGQEYRLTQAELENLILQAKASGRQEQKKQESRTTENLGRTTQHEERPSVAEQELDGILYYSDAYESLARYNREKDRKQEKQKASTGRVRQHRGHKKEDAENQEKSWVLYNQGELGPYPSRVPHRTSYASFTTSSEESEEKPEDPRHIITRGLQRKGSSLSVVATIGPRGISAMEVKLNPRQSSQRPHNSERRKKKAGESTRRPTIADESNNSPISRPKRGSQKTSGYFNDEQNVGRKAEDPPGGYYFGEDPPRSGSTSYGYGDIKYSSYGDPQDLVQYSSVARPADLPSERDDYFASRTQPVDKPSYAYYVRRREADYEEPDRNSSSTSAPRRQPILSQNTQ